MPFWKLSSCCRCIFFPPLVFPASFILSIFQADVSSDKSPNIRTVINSLLLPIFPPAVSPASITNEICPSCWWHLSAALYLSLVRRADPSWELLRWATPQGELQWSNRQTGGFFKQRRDRSVPSCSMLQLSYVEVPDFHAKQRIFFVKELEYVTVKMSSKWVAGETPIFPFDRLMRRARRGIEYRRLNVTQEGIMIDIRTWGPNKGRILHIDDTSC